ncbi:MAG: arginase family protein, partial [Promethearchaeota archaeon]
DVGNVTIYPLDEAKTRQSIMNSINFVLESTKAPVICIGGDHSIAFHEMHAYSKVGKIGVVWIDAHRDLLDELYGSKYSHGSPLRRAIEEEVILPENVLIIGTRYMTTLETHFLEENNMSEMKMVDIEDMSNARCEIKNRISELAKNVDHIFLSIDIDAMDPAYAPGTGYPVAGGFTSSLLLNLIHDFPVPIRGADIVEVSPPLDHSDITMKLLMAIITELCAKAKTMKV